MLDSLPELYSMSDGATKKKIPGCTYAEKLVEWLRAQDAGLSGLETARLQDKISRCGFWKFQKTVLLYIHRNNFGLIHSD